MLGRINRNVSVFKPKVVIVSAKRSPIGSFMGSLSGVSPVYLASSVIQHCLNQSRLVPGQVTQLITGQSLQSGMGQSLSRQVSQNASLPDSVVSFNISKSSASGLKALTLACQTCVLDKSQISLALGLEVSSHAPFLLPNNRKGVLIGDETLADSLLTDGSICPITKSFPGRLAEDTASRFEISRPDQDHYSSESYTRAREAHQRLFFNNEVEKIEVFTKAADKKFVREDEELRKMDLASLPHLRTLFLKDGTITAGNSAKFADGASALVCLAEDRAAKIGIKPLARVLAWADFETDPKHFLEGTKDVVMSALKKAGISIDIVDLFEIHEDFSLSVLVFLKMTGVPRDKVNVNGGALALGHPAAMSGARIVSTLIYALREKNKRIGVAAVSHPGGGASAVVIEVV